MLVFWTHLFPPRSDEDRTQLGEKGGGGLHSGARLLVAGMFAVYRPPDLSSYRGDAILYGERDEDRTQVGVRAGLYSSHNTTRWRRIVDLFVPNYHRPDFYLYSARGAGGGGGRTQ